MAVEADPRSDSPAATMPTPRGRVAGVARAALLALAAVLTAGALAQFFLAGLGVFDAPGYWTAHEALGSALGLVAFVAWIPALLGGVGRRVTGATLLLPALYTLQHVFPHLEPAWLRALHPLNGACLFALSLWLGVRALGLLQRTTASPVVTS